MLLHGTLIVVVAKKRPNHRGLLFILQWEGAEKSLWE